MPNMDSEIVAQLKIELGLDRSSGDLTLKELESIVNRINNKFKSVAQDIDPKTFEQIGELLSKWSEELRIAKQRLADYANSVNDLYTTEEEKQAEIAMAYNERYSKQAAEEQKLNADKLSRLAKIAAKSDENAAREAAGADAILAKEIEQYNISQDREALKNRELEKQDIINARAERHNKLNKVLSNTLHKNANTIERMEHNRAVLNQRLSKTVVGSQKHRNILEQISIIENKIRKSKEQQVGVIKRAVEHAFSWEKIMNRMAFVITAKLSYELFNIATSILPTIISNTIKWEDEQSKIYGLLDSTEKAYKNVLDEETLRLMTKYGAELEKASKSIYDILSARFAPQQVEEISEIAGKLSVAEFTDIAKATDYLTTTLNSMNIAVGDSGDVFNKVSQAITDGKFRLEDITKTISKLYTSANNLGIPLEEANALLADLTKKGVPADSAITYLSQLFFTLAKPTEKASKAMDKFNRHIDFARVKTEGMAYVLDQLKGANEDFILTLVKTRTGARAIMPLLNDTTSYLEALKNQYEATDAGQKKYEERLGTTQLAINNFKGEIFKLTLVGKENLLPLVKDFYSSMSGLLENVIIPITEYISQFSGDSLIRWLNTVIILLPIIVINIGRIRSAVDTLILKLMYAGSTAKNVFTGMRTQAKLTKTELFTIVEVLALIVEGLFAVATHMKKTSSKKYVAEMDRQMKATLASVAPLEKVIELTKKLTDISDVDRDVTLIEKLFGLSKEDYADYLANLDDKKSQLIDEAYKAIHRSDLPEFKPQDAIAWKFPHVTDTETQQRMFEAAQIYYEKIKEINQAEAVANAIRKVKLKLLDKERGDRDKLISQREAELSKANAQLELDNYDAEIEFSKNQDEDAYNKKRIDNIDKAIDAQKKYIDVLYDGTEAKLKARVALMKLEAKRAAITGAEVKTDKEIFEFEKLRYSAGEISLDALITAAETYYKASTNEEEKLKRKLILTNLQLKKAKEVYTQQQLGLSLDYEIAAITASMTKDKLDDIEISRDAAIAKAEANYKDIKDKEKLKELLELINKQYDEMAEKEKEKGKFSPLRMFGIEEYDEYKDIVADIEGQIAGVIMDFQNQILQHQLDTIEQGKEARLRALTEEYDAYRDHVDSIVVTDEHRQRMLASINKKEEEEKAKIEEKTAKEMAEQQKSNAMASATIDYLHGLISIYAAYLSIPVLGEAKAIELSGILTGIYLANMALMESTEYKATGGLAGDKHPGRPRGNDTIPAWLTPGEMVFQKKAVSGNESDLLLVNQQLATGKSFKQFVIDYVTGGLKTSPITVMQNSPVQYMASGGIAPNITNINYGDTQSSEMFDKMRKEYAKNYEILEEIRDYNKKTARNSKHRGGI